MKKKTQSSTISKQQRDQAFATTMQMARTHMNPIQRTFSRFIHTKFIDTLSTFVGGTILRPRAIIYGSVLSIVVASGLYGASKYYGYSMPGSEPIVAFVVGWSLGLIVDYAQVLAKGSYTLRK